jgi:hypothetical protein
MVCFITRTVVTRDLANQKFLLMQQYLVEPGNYIWRNLGDNTLELILQQREENPTLIHFILH